MTCPNCHQDAPTIVRGLRAYCTACGAPRPLSTAASAVNVVDQTAKVGGGLASALGVAALLVGVLLALVFGGIAKWLFGTALILVSIIVLFTLLVALPLFFGGRRLSRAGEDRVRAMQEQAVFALAARQRGVVTVGDVARALSVREEAADALLTALAKRPDGRVTLELDDNGGLSYLFQDVLPGRRVRIAERPWQPPQVRIGQAAAGPQVIDAELIDEEAQARGEGTARPVSR
jgi:hypothetical protein